MGRLCQTALWRTRRCARLPVPLPSPDRYCQQPARRLRRHARDVQMEGLPATADARYKLMTLDVNAFIRRFLIHVRPDGFHRIRHYGLFANANRTGNIALARRLLAVPDPAPSSGESDDTENRHEDDEWNACPCCGGRMIIIKTLSPPRQPPQWPHPSR